MCLGSLPWARLEGPRVTIDIVIVSYNSRRNLRGCLCSFLDCEGVRAFVVDNASSDGSLDTVADLPVTAVQEASNRGFAHGCNVGWRLGDAPFVLLLNPDARIGQTSLDALVDCLDDERVGAAGPRIVGADGALALSQRRFRRLSSTYAQALFLHNIFRKAAWANEIVQDVEAYGRPQTPDWISGACILVRRGVLEQLGGLDESFFLYCEDEDLCRRIRRLGLEVRYEPRAVVVHEGGASAARPDLLPVLAASRLTYSRKHDRALAGACDRVGIGIEALTHAILGRGGRRMRRGHARALRVVLSSAA